MQLSMDELIAYGENQFRAGYNKGWSARADRETEEQEIAKFKPKETARKLTDKELYETARKIGLQKLYQVPEDAPAPPSEGPPDDDF